ncbi:hypothetical protein [Mycobacterium sp.]|uniref:hypothetical protein n=1 Tax=Mycobacterium sp. TaxID=1785 RepID=UPI003342238B
MFQTFIATYLRRHPNAAVSLAGWVRAEVVEHYVAGMSCRRVADTVGFGRTTVLQILRAAGVEIRPQILGRYLLRLPARRSFS